MRLANSQSKVMQTNTAKAPKHGKDLISSSADELGCQDLAGSKHVSKSDPTLMIPRIRPWSVFPHSKFASITKEHTMVSLFSGCGGLDLGFHYAGFEILWANDINKDACATYKANIGNVVPGDIVEIGFPNLSRGIDVVAAGFPCQSFSNAGSRRCVDDERGALYRVALKAVNHFRPKAFIFENVRGLMSARDGGKLVVQNICEELGAQGYRCYVRLIDASKYHVAQRRLRLIILGILNDPAMGSFSFPFEVEQNRELSIEATIFDVPEDAPNQDELMQLNPQAYEIAALVPEGGSWKDIPYEKLPDRLKKIRDDIARYRWPKFYRKFTPHEVSGTITAAFKPENAGVWHPKEARVFSVREIARIQSFPDWFVFYGSSVKAKYQQIGNAVPPRLAYELAQRLAQVLKGRSPEGICDFLSLDDFLSRGKPLRPADPGISYAAS